MQGMVSLQLPFYKGLMAIIQTRSNDLYANRMSHTSDDNKKGNDKKRKDRRNRQAKRPKENCLSSITLTTIADRPNPCVSADHHRWCYASP